jgi:phosphate transport system substrate-binding protein
MIASIVMILGLLLSAHPASSQAAEPPVTGSVVVAGNGPELRMAERLARAFEKAHRGTFVDVVWDENSKPIEMVKSGQAHIAVTGKEEPDLKATPVGWDGIAVMVNLSNHTKEVTTQQVADIFSGKVKMWSELGGPETRILIIDRPHNRNIRDAFERYLGIEGKIPDRAKVIGPDDKAIKTVVGTLPPLSAVTYISLGPALDAVSTGVAVRLLPIDKAEPEEPTIKDGRYKLRRAVLFLTKKETTPVVDAFLAFTLSKDGQKIVDEEAYIPYTPLDQKK